VDRARPRRDPDPGAVGSALERIDNLLAAAEQQITAQGQDELLAVGQIHAAATIAATERLPAEAALELKTTGELY
jgi:hypothetical protein